MKKVQGAESVDLYSTTLRHFKTCHSKWSALSVETRLKLPRIPSNSSTTCALIQGERQPRLYTSLEGSIPYEVDRVADLWSRRCRARQEHESCFEGHECVATGF